LWECQSGLLLYNNSGIKLGEEFLLHRQSAVHGLWKSRVKIREALIFRRKHKYKDHKNRMVAVQPMIY
jgi:hypothetical protein